MILEPTAPLPGTSKTMKMITVLCISYDSEASRSPSRPLPKIMKMVTVLCICYDSEANRPPTTSPPSLKRNGNQCVFYDFGGGAGGPSPPTSPKDYGNHYVFNDFGRGAGPLSPPTCDHYGQVVRKPDPDLVPNLVPTLCQAPPTRFSMGWGRGVLPPSPKVLENLIFFQILRKWEETAASRNPKIAIEWEGTRLASES